MPALVKFAIKRTHISLMTPIGFTRATFFDSLAYLYRGFKGKEDARSSEPFPGEDVSALTLLE